MPRVKRADIAKDVKSAEKKPMKIPLELLELSRHKPNASAIDFARMFKPAEPFPGVVPKDWKRPTLAMDEAGFEGGAEAYAPFGLMYGTYWPGFQALAAQAQRPEFRRISEIISTEMARKWIKFESKSTDGDKSDRITELEDAIESYDVRGKFQELALQDGEFGRSHLYLDLGTSHDRDELQKPIGDGRNDLSKAKCSKEHPLKRLQTVEAMWCYPSFYNANDPLLPDWYKPQEWFVQGKRLHASRLLTFIGREVPDLLKPAYSFGGLSLTQMAEPYVDNWIRTRQSVSDLIHSFSVFVLKTDLQALLQTGNVELINRIELFNNFRDNRGMMVLNKDSEDFANVSASIGGLDHLQAQALEQCCVVSGIPLVKYTGISPSGLNSTSEEEIRVFYDWIHAYQQVLWTKQLTTVIHFIMLSIWDEVDPDIVFTYEPLWSMSDKEAAEIRQMDANSASTLIQAGVISPDEERQTLASDPSTKYQGLDVAEPLDDADLQGQVENDEPNTPGIVSRGSEIGEPEDGEPDTEVEEAA